MSTELRNVNDRLAQTRFWGGNHRGMCLQVTQVNDGGYVTVTRNEAVLLAQELLLFANGDEVEDEVEGEVVTENASPKADMLLRSCIQEDCSVGAYRRVPYNEKGRLTCDNCGHTISRFFDLETYHANL